VRRLSATPVKLPDLSGIDVVRRHAAAGDSAALIGIVRESDDRRARVEAATVLGSFASDVAAEDALARVLRTDRSADVRAAAARALATSEGGEATRDILVLGLSDPSDDVSMWCAYSLGRLRCLDAVEPLSRLLSSSSPWKRVYAVQALGRIRHRRAVPFLLKALEDKQRMVYAEALDSLALVADDRELEALDEVRRRAPLSRRRRIRRLRERIAKERAGGP
jgi:HEAT repeat protein